MRFDAIVIGGGAAGMIAAGRAAERGKRVPLLEKNKTLGEKLKITGGGRCNITNAEPDERLFLKNYGNAEQFLYSPFSQFGVKDTFSFFESRGLPLVIQEENRVFPKTERALDVARVLEKYMRDNGVAIKLGESVYRIVKKDNRVIGVVAGEHEYEADSVILATGGLSHPETGSTGEGFKWLLSLGHKVRKPTLALVPLAVKEDWVKKSAGTALDPVKITFFSEGKKIFFLRGRILLTHFGISGPLILNAAGRVGDLLEEGAVAAAIDAYPDKNLGELEKWIIGIFDANKNKELKNVFKEIAPQGIAARILPLLSGIDQNINVHSITKEQRKAIVHTLKALPITITNLLGYDRAIVADGGVLLNEIDTRTMRSRLYENLFVVGDLLDINRPSGGYSLQLCWTTGYVAGSSV
ncbi:MAG: aminoacetone oxidase family FAD-binding enzyme [Candidatus Wildermuthbacteria bacterium]|nr:aminoacetone oxidase family FAD-binding enzyme [Candidatus Wildermuthbacteria bacterium]